MRCNRERVVEEAAPGGPGSAPFGLRPLRLEDIEWFVGIRNLVRESLHDPRAFSAEEASEWFVRTQPDLRVIERASRAVGYFRVGPLCDDGRSLWIGADLDPAFHGLGIASAAYRRFMPVFVDEFDVDSLVLRVRPWNVPAMRLYRRLGFFTTSISTDVAAGDHAVLITDITMRWLPGRREPEHGDLDAVDLILESRAGDSP